MLLEQFKFTTEELMEERRKRNFNIDTFCKYELMNMISSKARYMPLCDIEDYIPKNSKRYHLLMKYTIGVYSSDSIFIPFLSDAEYFKWYDIYNYEIRTVGTSNTNIEKILKDIVSHVFDKGRNERPLPYNAMDLTGKIKIKKEYESLMFCQDEFMVTLNPSMLQKYNGIGVKESEKIFKETFDYLEEYLSLDETEREYTVRKWSEHFPKPKDGTVEASIPWSEE